MRKKIRIYSVILSIVLIFTFSGCGKKGPPSAPGEIKIIAIKNIKGKAREGKIYLTWRMEKKKEAVRQKSNEEVISESGGEEADSIEGNEGEDIEKGNEAASEANNEKDNEEAGNGEMREEVSDESDNEEASDEKGSEEAEIIPVELKEFRIYRIIPETENAVSGKEDFELIGIVNIDEKQDLSKKIEYIDDKGLIKGNWYHYVVACIDKKDKLYAMSDTVDVFFSIEPQSPGGLRAELKENYILLQWNPPEKDLEGNPVKNIIGYNVYRKSSKERTFAKVNKSLIKRERYIDMEIERDEEYSYSVRVVDNYYPPWHESADSNIVQVKNMDVVPPRAPKNMIVIGGVGRISLTWDRNTETDLAGYRVYRSNFSGKGYELLNKDLVSENFFDDISLERDRKYFYVVTAVDNSENGNESPFSKEGSGIVQ